MCQLGNRVRDTFVATTPWTIELDLDTGYVFPEFGGDRCRVTRVDPGPDKLWVWAFDSESLRLSKYVATQYDMVDFDMRGWFCRQGKP